jgi:hypothetical protein
MRVSVAGFTTAGLFHNSVKQETGESPIAVGCPSRFRASARPGRGSVTCAVTPIYPLPVCSVWADPPIVPHHGGVKYLTHSRAESNRQHSIKFQRRRRIGRANVAVRFEGITGEE